MSILFRDRRDAGRQLAVRLGSYTGRDDVAVLALPRGGVPVGFEVAQALGVPLDILLVRKLGVPGQEELAMGAIASGGVQVLNDDVVRFLPDADRLIAAAAARELPQLRRREEKYRSGRSAPDLSGKTIILVDDGLATGSTMRGAILALRSRSLGRIIVAVPVGAPETCRALRNEADDVICLSEPDDFQAVQQSYQKFGQTSDEEVCALLARAATPGVIA